MNYLIQIYRPDEYPKSYLVHLPDPTESVILQGKLEVLSQEKNFRYTMLNLSTSNPMTAETLLQRLEA